MDLAYFQQQQVRRKSRSAGSLQHLSLAPLTTRLPLHDDFDNTGIIDSHTSFANSNGNGHSLAHIPSYIQGRSAPTTPRLLSKSPPSRSRSHEGGRVLTDGSRTPTAAISSVSANSKGPSNGVPKSRSTTHLLSNFGGTAGDAAGRHNTARHHRRRKTDHSHGESSGDWLLRAAVLVTSEARESKGQSWLTTRASSTSLTGLRGVEEADDAVAFERELAREREYLERIAGSSRRGSRRGSLEHEGLTSPVAAARSTTSRSVSQVNNRLDSRANSRAHSQVGSRAQLFTTIDRRSLDRSNHGEPLSSPAAAGDYLDYAGLAVDDEHHEVATPDGPDFVNLDEKLEALELHQHDTSLEDEDHVRRLVKREKAGGVMGSWFGSVFGWSLFSVQETEGEGETGEESSEDENKNEDEEEEEDDDEESGTGGGSETSGASEAAGAEGAAANGKKRKRRQRTAAIGWNQKQLPWANRRRFEGDEVNRNEDDIPPPPCADGGTWQDAAWLLSVASKVIL